MQSQSKKGKTLQNQRLKIEMPRSKSSSQLFVVQWDISSVDFYIVLCATVPLLANVRLRGIIVVDGLNIHGPRGASYIDRLQIDKHAHTHTCAHICTQSCLAWSPIEAGPNINYLFFSRGLVTVIRVRGFLESGAHTV